MARYEDSGVHGYPQAAELRPAEDVLEGQAGGSPVHHGSEVGGRPCREMSNRASSSAKTQPAARSLVSARPGHPTFRVGGQIFVSSLMTASSTGSSTPRALPEELRRGLERSQAAGTTNAAIAA